MNARLVLAVCALMALAGSGRADDPAIAYEVRVLTLRGEAIPNLATKEGAVAFLNDDQLKALLTDVQGRARVNVMQAPKMTAADGQEAAVIVADRRSFVTGVEAALVKGQAVLVPKSKSYDIGERINLVGRVAADGRSVRATFKFSSTEVAGPVPLVPVTSPISPVAGGGKPGQSIPFTQFLQVPTIDTLTVEKELVIHAGRHAVITASPREREERHTFTTPILSDLPLVGRLFTSVGYGRTTVRTVLIVSATVIEQPTEIPPPPAVER
jgi:hypothetical protein